MRAPRPVLRKLHNNSQDVARVALVIPPGDELEVSEAVAGQLQAGSGQLQDGPAPQALLDELASQAAERERAERERAEGAENAARRSAGLPLVGADIPADTPAEPTPAKPDPAPVKRATKKTGA